MTVNPRIGRYPANTRLWSSTALNVGHRILRLSGNNPIFVQCHLFAGLRISRWYYLDGMTPSTIPENTTQLPNVCTMLAHRLRRWPNIGQTLGSCVVFAVYTLLSQKAVAAYFSNAGKQLGPLPFSWRLRTTIPPTILLIRYNILSTYNYYRLMFWYPSVCLASYQTRYFKLISHFAPVY